MANRRPFQCNTVCHHCAGHTNLACELDASQPRDRASPRKGMRDHVSRLVQTEMRKTCKKRRLPASHVLKRGQRASREADRTSEALPSANPRQQEADPDHAREEPSRTPDATWRGFQGEWRLARTPEGTRACSESSEPVPSGALPKMLDSQREASLEETHPVCWRVGHQLARSLTPGRGILRPQLHAQHEPQCRGGTL